MRDTKSPVAEQSVPDASNGHRRLSAKTFATLLAAAVTAAQTAWFGTLAWGLYQAVGSLV